LLFEGEIVRATEVFVAWFKDILVHLIIDVVGSALITAVLEALLKNARA